MSDIIAAEPVALFQPGETPPVEWPKPIVNDVATALDDVTARTARLRALLSTNSAALNDCLLHVSLAGMPDGAREQAYSVWQVFVHAGETLSQIETLIIAIQDAYVREPASAVGKFLQVRLKDDYLAALDAYREAAKHGGDHEDEESFVRAGRAIFQTLTAYVETRAPDLRSLHEKLCIIRDQDALGHRGVLDAVLDDVEFLTRRIEIREDLVKADPEMVA